MIYTPRKNERLVHLRVYVPPPKKRKNIWTNQNHRIDFSGSMLVNLRGCRSNWILSLRIRVKIPKKNLWNHHVGSHREGWGVFLGASWVAWGVFFVAWASIFWWFGKKSGKWRNHKKRHKKKPRVGTLECSKHVRLGVGAWTRKSHFTRKAWTAMADFGWVESGFQPAVKMGVERGKVDWVSYI